MTAFGAARSAPSWHSQSGTTPALLSPTVAEVWRHALEDAGF
ncbi:MAG: hypothetical protein ACJ71Y_10980 [Blastococcus sp.]|jgi:hypothetical protein